MSNFLFTSKRLGFRNWTPADIDAMVKISADPEVMKFFPNVATEKQTRDFKKRMQQLFEEKRYCYFACIELKSNNLIGFIGLAEPSYTTEFTPCVDIGWRLSPTFWGKGYATEGAKRCLAYGFQEIGLKKIISTAPKINKASIQVMRKIGMQKRTEFKHPRLLTHPNLTNCMCYEINKEDFISL